MVDATRLGCRSRLFGREVADSRSCGRLSPSWPPARLTQAQVLCRELLAATLAGARFSLLPYARNLPLFDQVRDLVCAQALHLEDVVTGAADGVPYDPRARLVDGRWVGEFVHPDRDGFDDPEPMGEIVRAWLDALPHAAFDEAARMAFSGQIDVREVAVVNRRERRVRLPRPAHMPYRDRGDVEPSEVVQRMTGVDAEQRQELPDRSPSARVRREVDALTRLQAARLLHARLSDAIGLAELIGDPDGSTDWAAGPVAAAARLEALRDMQTDAWMDAVGLPRAVLPARPEPDPDARVRSGSFPPAGRGRMVVRRLPVSERSQEAQTRRAAVVARLLAV